jgi:hypothetical protein
MTITGSVTDQVHQIAGYVDRTRMDIAIASRWTREWSREADHYEWDIAFGADAGTVRLATALREAVARTSPMIDSMKKSLATLEASLKAARAQIPPDPRPPLWDRVCDVLGWPWIIRAVMHRPTRPPRR